MIAISPEKTGAQKWLLQESRNSKMTWVDYDPMVVTFGRGSLPLEEITYATGLEQPIWPPQRYVQAFRELKITDNIRWQHSMPKDVFKKGITDVLGGIWDILDDANVVQYVEHFKITQQLFSSLQKLKVNAKLWQELYDEGEGEQKTLLATFKPDRLGFAQKIEYTRNTSTGRIAVSSGPEILRLSKKNRACFESRYNGGRLIYVDYSSLEPRTLLAATGVDIGDSDVYDHISSVFLGGKIDRERVKLIVMAILYGAGASRIREIVSEHDPLEIMSEVRHAFNVKVLERKLLTQFKENGVIRTRTGRVLRPARHDGPGLMSYYVQATGAENSLVGFASLCDKIRELNLSIAPIFIVHDAIILDVHPDVPDEKLRCVLNAAEMGTCEEIKLPVKVKSILE